MSSEKVLCGLIRNAYEAAADPCHWSVFLDSFAQAVKSPAVALIVQDLRNPRGSVSEGLGFDPLWERRYGEYFGGINVWIERAPHLFQPGMIPRSDHVMTDRELANTEFGHDFLRPQNHFYSFGSVLTEEEAVISCITAMRSKSAGPFGETEVELLRELTPHLQSALRVHGRIASLENRLNGLTNALDHMAQGVMLVDADGKPGFVNRYAEEILRAGNGLTLRRSILHARRPDQTLHLLRLIAEATNSAGVDPLPGGRMTVTRTSGRRGLNLMVAPLVSGLPKISGESAAIVFVNDPERVPDPKARELEQLLQLTTAEARLAKSLAAGKTLQAFTRESGVSLNTARSHLKQIFGKTGVRRQADLIRLVLTVAPSVLDG
jgi:DNA-binding CsgD family transcriptional regulator